MNYLIFILIFSSCAKKLDLEDGYLAPVQLSGNINFSVDKIFEVELLEESGDFDKGEILQGELVFKGKDFVKLKLTSETENIVMLSGKGEVDIPVLVYSKEYNSPTIIDTFSGKMLNYFEDNDPVDISDIDFIQMNKDIKKGRSFYILPKNTPLILKLL